MVEFLQDGINEYKAGNKEKAREIFRNVVKEHPDHIKAWEWLLQTAQDDYERLSILESILKLNPTHEQAQKIRADLIQKVRRPASQIPTQPEPQPMVAEPSKKYAPVPQKVIAPQPITPPHPQKSNNNTLIIVVSGLIVAFCCFCFIIYLNTPTPAGTPSVFSGYEVRYVISGSAQSASVTYFNQTGGIEQINTNIPWEKEMNVETGASLSLVAQNGGRGSITCEIWINGEKTKTSTSTAEYGIVTCTDFAY
jgi:hypothetical protein